MPQTTDTISNLFLFLSCLFTLYYFLFVLSSLLVVQYNAYLMFLFLILRWEMKNKRHNTRLRSPFCREISSKIKRILSFNLKYN